MNMDEIAQGIWGVDSSAFDDTDAILVEMIVAYVNRQGTLHLMNLVAIKVIVELSAHDPWLARQYMAELAG